MKSNERAHWRKTFAEISKFVDECSTVSELLAKHPDELELIYDDELDIVNDPYTIGYRGGEFEVTQRHGWLSIDEYFTIQSIEFRAPIKIGPYDIED